MSIDGGLRALFRAKLPEAHWQSIETGAIGSGVPDSNYCVDGVDGWVEFKAAVGNAVTIRPPQIAWISRRVRGGGRVAIAVRRQHDGGPRRGNPVDELWVVAGRDVVALHREGLLGVEPLLRLTGGPRHWDWAAVLAALKT